MTLLNGDVERQQVPVLRGDVRIGGELRTT
jgi:hypothetical protein